MPVFNPPRRDQQFVMHELLKVSDVYKNIPDFAEVDAETMDQILDAAGQFCAEVLLPTNMVGDQEGCKYDPATHLVKTPTGFKEAYAQFVEGGWGSLTANPAYGGQGLPRLLEIIFYEMQYSTNQAWAMYPGLAHGAYSAMEAHANNDIKNTYLPKITSGQWLGTMCLTEPHCGTDLGMLRSKAEPQGDGSYAISGNKIFISGGENDLAENIVHLVLARLPDAPAGTKGISLFVVPKFLPNGSGPSATLGARNEGIYCGGIEHKMGINGSATCQMVMDKAIGWLVGEPNKGLNAMFVMMNGARLGVGMQGLGLNEVVYQNALAYARDRIQGRSLRGVKAKDKAADPIIVHADIRRVLLTAKAYTEGGRAFGYWVATMIDQSMTHPDEEVRNQAKDMLALTTPIVKAFMTDNGMQCAVDCQGVLGGHGYVKEWGMEQFVRDARINMIYEGTNAIQSLDLLGRKVLQDGGAKLRTFGNMIKDLVADNMDKAETKEFIEPLMDIGDKVQKLTMEIGMKAMSNPDEVGAASTHYLRVAGHLIYAYFWARMGIIAKEKVTNNHSDTFYQSKLATARFYFARLLPETAYHIRAARAGSASLMELPAELF